MVSCDNTAFLLTQLRAAFVGGDDTGVCELLIDRIRVCDEEVLALLSPPCGAGRGESQTSLTEQPDPFGPPAGAAGQQSATDSQASLAGEAHSPDIIPPKLESGQAPSRKKSATQMRVSAAREERQREKKTAVAVEWSDDVSGVTDSDLDYLFPAPDAAVAPSAPTKTDDSNSAPAESVEIRLNKTPRQNGGSSRAPAKRQSLLAKRLAENLESAVQNPFTEFSQFEVSVSRQGLRRIRVFFYDFDRSRPVEVVPIRDTTVEQFTGLACYKYTLESRQPPLPPHVGIDELDLFMYEEADDLDSDFPPLEKRDRIYKYDFSTLAAVQRHPVQQQSQQQQLTQQQRRQSNQLIVHVSLPQGFTTMQLDRSLPVSSLLEKIVRRRKLKEHRGHKYALRRADDVSVQVPLDTPLGDAGTTEFILVRDNSTPAQGTAQPAAEAGADAAAVALKSGQVADPAASSTGHLASQQASHYQQQQHQLMLLSPPHSHQPDLLDSLALRQYRLQLRSVINRDVMLSVSGDCVVLDHLGGKAKLFSKRSPSTYSWEAIGGCQLEERSGSSKATVQLFYRNATSPGVAFGGSLSTNFHCLSLESSDARLVKELHAQVNNVLLLRGGSARKLFLELTVK
ncbi:hypothetical protein BOX15_Mlig025548g1 [Macrostomum lignano]|uniref:Target of rapamycin complex 2 subunit MAPKAP1 n=1 Tax=Macrostomum lignano TaxID=282301 RepID=A0A267GZX8_9PLAT|nr:hypothetical protein BOX15_Mlig025548g1 [Macrostomum lignano]